MTTDTTAPADDLREAIKGELEGVWRGAEITDAILALIAPRLSAARDEGRREGIEQAADYAQDWLQRWGGDLLASRDEYIDAQTSGVMTSGRRIRPELARQLAREMKERGEAVYDCGDAIATAIRALADAPRTAEREGG